MNMVILMLYGLSLCIFSLFTWGLVDTNLPFKIPLFPSNFAYIRSGLITTIYSILVAILFLFYARFLWLAKMKRLKIKEVIIFIAITVIILYFSFPAFSYDIFNYIATAKVTFFYRENPYIVMPIEIPNEPMLAFMHAANKIALYGPVWIALTVLPFIVGSNNLFITIFAFKAFVSLFYLGLVWLIWRMSEKNIQSVVFFALNPLVVLEILNSAHNDVVMMFFALLSFLWLKERKFIFSSIAFFLSIGIKFATVFLIPVYLYVFYQMVRNEKTDWSRQWVFSAVAMYVIFLLSPLREEIYSWYLIWPLTFVSLLERNSLLSFISVGFSFGLLFRIAPFLYTREWGGITPLTKKIVTFVPPFILSIYYAIRKKI